MVNHLALIDFPDVECRISSLGAYSMERTSSLDLFRGSADGSFFSDLNFLEELPAEAEPVSHSQPLPASLPLQHTAGSQRPAVSAQHSSSSLSTTPAFGVAWPQTIGRLPSRVYSRPVNFPDTFLHPSTHPINHTRHSDSQPDSSIALLNDDTALGFADDCFRRESDLFLSQDRVSQHDAHAVNHVAAADGVNGPSMIQLQGYNLTADSTQQQSVHATSFRPSLAATGSETIKPAPSANKLDTQAPATTPAEHDAAAIDQGPLEVPEQATPQDSSKTQAAQTTEANHQPPVIQPGVHGNDDDHSSAALNLPGHTEAVVGPVTKVAADADEPTVACPVTEQSSPVLPALSQASAAPTADSSKVNQLLVHQEQAVQLGQASKLKLAVQDYQPHNAQAPRGDNAEALAISKPAAAPAAPVVAEGQCSPANHHTAGKSTASQTQIPVPTAEQAEPQVTQQSLHNKPTCSLNHSPVTEPRLDKGLEALTVPLSPQGLPSHNPAANLLLEQVKLLQQAKLTRQPALPEAPLTLLIPIAQTGNGPPVTQRPAPQHVASPAKKLLVSDLTPVRAPASGACQGANRQLSPSDIFHAISSAAKPATEPPATEHTAADSAASPVAPSAIPATASTAVLAAAPLAAATSDVPASAHHSVPASVPSAVLTIASPTASTPPDNADRPAVVSNTLPLACSIGQPASSQSQASSVVGSLDLEHDGPVPAATEQRPVQSAGQGPHQHAKPICQSCLQHPAAEICPPAQVPVVAHPKAATAPNAAAVQSAAQPTAVEVPSQLVADVSAQPAAGTEGEKPDQATTVEPDAVAISAATEAMPGRVKRLPGGDPLEAAPFRRFVEMVRSNSHDFEAQGRVLRLKQYINSDIRPAAINAILEALAVNTLIEVLYIQNFEQGMFDDQLLKLIEVLKKGRIWALNAGENFEISMDAWKKFSEELKDTAVAYLYVSEHHLARTDLKKRMKDAIRQNRKQAPVRDVEVIKCVRNMWWNPKLPGDCSKTGAGKASGESALASLARDMAASQAGSRHSAGSNSQSRKRKAVTKEAAADTGNSMQKNGKRQCATGAATAKPSEAQAQSSPTRKPGSRLRHSTQQQQQQQESADLADSDADSAHQPDLSIAVPDASSMRAGSARLAQRRASHRPAPDESATLAPQSNNSKPKPVGGRRDKAITAHRQDVSCSQSGQEDAVAGSEVHQTASDGTVQSTEAEQELAPVRTGQKRKRQPPRAIQQQHAVAAVPVQSTRRIKGPELSTLMPLQSRKANPQARHTPRQPAAHADQAVDADASNSLRRTGRQRKLTAAAAAAVEEFPSLYRQPRHPPAKGGQSPAADSVGTSEDASAEAPASSSQKAKHGPAKRSRVQESPALPGINHVQMRQLVRHGVIPAGTHEFLFDSKQPCEVEVLPDGDILYQGDLYESLAKLGKSVLQDSHSRKQSCNCWKDFSWKGQKLEMLRQAAHAKHMEAKRVK